MLGFYQKDKCLFRHKPTDLDECRFDTRTVWLRKDGYPNYVMTLSDDEQITYKRHNMILGTRFVVTSFGNFCVYNGDFMMIVDIFTNPIDRHVLAKIFRAKKGNTLNDWMRFQIDMVRATGDARLEIDKKILRYEQVRHNMIDTFATKTLDNIVDEMRTFNHMKEEIALLRKLVETHERRLINMDKMMCQMVITDPYIRSIDGRVKDLPIENRKKSP